MNDFLMHPWLNVFLFFPGGALQWTGWLTIASLTVWAALRIILFVHEKINPIKIKQELPVDTQKMGLAQGLGQYDIIESLVEYEKRRGGMKGIYRAAKIQWPLLTWINLSLFLLLFSAQGIGQYLQTPWIVSIMISFFTLSTLGLFDKNWWIKHIKSNDMKEGKSLDWDESLEWGGMIFKVRWKEKKHDVPWCFDDDQWISKDRNEIYQYMGIQAQPDSVYQHGRGIVVSHFFMTKADLVPNQNWMESIALRDILEAVLNGLITAQSLQQKTIIIMECKEAHIMVMPSMDHVEYLEKMAQRLKQRKKTNIINTKEVALSSAQGFSAHFNDEKINEIKARRQWMKK